MRLAWIALRNLARNRRRTAISLAVVAAGTVALLLTAGFVRFSFQGLREALIRGGLGHLEVAREEAVAGRESLVERPLALGLDGWEALQREVEAVPGVLAAAPNVHLMGLISVPGGPSTAFVGVGVDPARERRMGFDLELDAGRALPEEAPPEGEDPVLLARGLAELLGVGPGDRVRLMTVTPAGGLGTLEARVAGLVPVGVGELDVRFVKLHRESARRLVGSDRVSDLVVTVDDPAQAEAVGRELERRLAGREPALAVVGWEERAPFYRQVRDLYLGIFWFLGSVIAVLVILAASNTLVMAVMERVRELGTLRALGTSRVQVALLVLAEALWLGLLGALLGDLAGLGAIAGINALGLEMAPPPGAVSPIDLRLAVVPEALVGAPLMMLAVLTVAAAGPILRAVRLQVAEALAHV